MAIYNVSMTITIWFLSNWLAVTESPVGDTTRSTALHRKEQESSPHRAYFMEILRTPWSVDRQTHQELGKDTLARVGINTHQLSKVTIPIKQLSWPLRNSNESALRCSVSLLGDGLIKSIYWFRALQWLRITLTSALTYFSECSGNYCLHGSLNEWRWFWKWKGHHSQRETFEWPEQVSLKLLMQLPKLFLEFSAIPSLWLSHILWSKQLPGVLWSSRLALLPPFAWLVTLT